MLKTTHLFFGTLAAGSLMTFSSAFAATYTWTQTATGNQDWTTAGNWDANGVFASGSSNELRFFAGTSGASNQLAAGTSVVVINVPTTLSMNTLTLNGLGPNNTAGSSVTIGTSASTWTFGDGSISTVNLNSLVGGGGADRDVRYTIGANLTLVGAASGITTFTGNSTSGIGALFSGNITGSGQGITKSGSSLLVFSGNNSYTGTTSITGGVLRLASNSALSGGIGTTGGTSALTLNGGVLELGAGDFSRGLGTGSSQFQITGGTSGFSAFDGPRVVTVGGDASQELQWGSAHFQPGTLVLNQAFSTQAAVYANGSIELANKIDLNGATRTVQVGANKAMISGDIRTTSGTAGLTKAGAGTLVLTGNNSYNGPTTISAGALSIGSVSNIGGSGSSNLVMSGGTLQITGTALTGLSDLDSTVTFSNTAKGFDIHSAANTFTVDQVLSGPGTGSTLTKSGVGTLVLNKNNSYAGATTVTGGGKLVLDYSDAVNGNGSKLSDTAALTLSGTALVLKGGSHTELVSSTTLGNQTGNSISRDGGTSKISLGALTAPSSSAMYTLAISEASIATTTTANANGILPLGRVTVGSHFGSNDGSGNIVAYSGYTSATTAGVGNANVVHQLSGGGTMAANLASYSLRIVNDADDNVLDLGARNINLTNNGTLLYAGGFNNNYTINGTTGAVTSNSGNQPFVINTYAGTTLTVNARVTSNFTSIQKAGEGTLVLGANSQLGDATGPTVVQQGVLRLAHKDALGTTTTGTVVQGGAALEISGGISDFAAEPLTINGVGISSNGALRNHSGSNTFAGAITIGASGARINANSGTSLTLTGGIATTLTQDVTFGGAGNTTVSTNAISGSGALVKDGAGTLTLSSANTYTNGTTVSAGKLLVNNASGSGTGSGAVTIGTNATLGGDGTIGGATTVSGALSPGNSIGTLTVSNDVTWNGGNAWVFELGAGNTSDRLNITGAGSDFLKGSGTSFVFNFAGSTSTGTFVLVDWSGSTSFVAGNFSYTNLGGGNSGTFTINEDESQLEFTAVVVPEPTTLGLLAMGAVGLMRRRR